MLPQNVALPPKVRAVLYYVVFVIGVLIIVGTAIFGSLGGTWPVWFKAFAAGGAALSSALGLTAASNTQTNLKNDVPAGFSDGADAELSPEQQAAQES